MPLKSDVPRTVASSDPYKEPSRCGGTGEEDVDEWWKQYKWVRKLNGWDTAVLRSYVMLPLTNTALPWYDNHEDTLTTWETFADELKKCFGGTTRKK